MMLSFCKKSVHLFLGFVNTCPKEFDSSSSCSSCSSPRRISLSSSFSPSNGLSSLIDSSDNHIQSSANIVESVKAPFMTPTLSSSSSPNSYAKRDNLLGTFFDEVGGAMVDGLTSCTESLGFESSDERRVDDNGDIVNAMNNDKLLMCSTSPRNYTRLPATSSRTARKINRARSFPPPLSSLKRNGHRCFFLKPVRRDGRLELTEVRVERPEILRASRENGRLRLHLITNDDEDEDGDYENEYETQSTTFEEEEEEAVQEEEEEMRNDMWKSPVAVGGGGEGLRRCHALVTPHHPLHTNHHGHFHAWSQHCVTIR